MKITKKNFEKNLFRGIDILFADAKLTWERVLSLVSALFWIWIEWQFLIFFFTYAFGFIGYLTGGYPESYNLILASKELIHAIVFVSVLVSFATRISVYNRKEVKQ